MMIMKIIITIFYSGKTYHALQRLKEADPTKGGGLYCGPLRLLALEVYESLNKQGVYTSLVTGQEKREVPGATHISSTVLISYTKCSSYCCCY